jgi:ankyrin repeat protein
MAEAEIEAIFTAVRRGDVEEVARILNAKPHLMEARILDSSDQMPLMMAAGRGHAGLVRLLLERGAKVNACNRYRETALLEAASGGHEEVVSILLGCGADPSRSDNANTTALINACFRDHLGVARQLIRHMQGPGLDQRNYDGSTALWWTCYNGNVEAARALLLAGADHTIVGMYGEAPRQAAELYEHPECVALLEVSWRVCYLLARRHHL